jgi:AraC family transcriptional regulator
MGRKPLLNVASGLVEDVGGRIAGRAPSAEEFSPDFQIAFPYRGVFTWHVGHQDVVGDPNQILFITGGEAFRVSGPRTGRYAEVILTPTFAVLSEITEQAGFDPRTHPLFRARRARATPAVQRTTATLLHWAAADAFRDPFAAEESMLEVIRAALRIEPTRVRPSVRTHRLISRTKEYLEFALTRPLVLSEIADAVGARATYLTDVFARFEGLSLRRYVTQLRLARALIHLGSADDLASLALDLGFSSHSHFTLAFRRAFGSTPSQFRAMLRRSRTPAAATVAMDRRTTR